LVLSLFDAGVRKGKAVANSGSTYVLAIDNLLHKTPKDYKDIVLQNGLTVKIPV
jgi:hypothetical protein